MEATAPKLTRAEKIAQGLPKPLSKMSRKKATAERMKDERKSQYYATLRNYPTSPRKMRLVADQVRGVDIDRALATLKLSTKHAAAPLRRLLLAAIDSFEQKSGQRADTPGLYVKIIHVDGAGMLKRLRPAPQGRGFRVRKRSNHVTLHLAVRGQENNPTVAPIEAAAEVPATKAPKAKAAPKAKPEAKATAEKAAPKKSAKSKNA
jgi:large subunit ribosomal protein L22